MLGWLRPRAVSCKPSKRQLTAESDDRHQTVVHAQHWQGNLPVETILPPLPDVDELNAKTDKTKWETGLDGKPRAPYVRNVVAYLLSPDGEEFTYVSETTGGRIAIERLESQIRNVRMIRRLASRKISGAIWCAWIRRR